MKKTSTMGLSATRIAIESTWSRYHWVSGALIKARRSWGSVMTTAFAGSLASNDSLRQKRNVGLALRFASQSRGVLGPSLPAASGVPQMMMRPFTLVNQISVVRDSPDLAPIVTMSMVRSLASALRISSSILSSYGSVCRRQLAHLCCWVLPQKRSTLVGGPCCLELRRMDTS